MKMPPEPELQRAELGPPDFTSWPGTVSIGLSLLLQLRMVSATRLVCQQVPGALFFQAWAQPRDWAAEMTTGPAGLCQVASKKCPKQGLSLGFEGIGEELRKLLGKGFPASSLLCKEINSSLKFTNTIWIWEIMKMSVNFKSFSIFCVSDTYAFSSEVQTSL